MCCSIPVGSDNLGKRAYPTWGPAKGHLRDWSAVKPTPERFTTTRINRNPDLNPGNFTSRAQFSLQ